MKLCQCCGARAEDLFLSCPKCGEASWVALASDEPKPAPKPAPKDQAES